MVQQDLLQGRSRRAAKRIVQNLESHIQLPVQAVPGGHVVTQIATLLLSGLIADGILPHHSAQRGKWLLLPNAAVNLQLLKSGQILFIQKHKFLRHIHITVQINIRIGRMVILPVELQEFFVGKFRDHRRIPPGNPAIGGVRVQGFHFLSKQHIFRGGKRSLHLIVHHAVNGQLSLRAVQFIMPAFLAENLVRVVNSGIEYRIQIYMHQVLEILVIAAGYRVNGLVRIGHGIQKSVQRTFHQFHKRVLHRELPGTAQHGVLQDMGHTCGILRRRAEADIEHLIIVIVLQQCNPGPGFFVPQQITHGI